jgi:hypothetical protein
MPTWAALSDSCKGEILPEAHSNSVLQNVPFLTSAGFLCATCKPGFYRDVDASCTQAVAAKTEGVLGKPNGLPAVMI